MKFFTSILMAIVFFFSSFGNLLCGRSTYSYEIDTTKLGEEVPNIVDNENVWDMGTQFINAEKNEKYDVFEFVDYVQLMQCTGGTAGRDLFEDPYDTSTFTDYNFSRLIENCRGIINLGAKPHLKLGGVPLKFTSDFQFGGFDMNPYPPDDFEQYYEYIKAIAQALVDEFGREELLTWRFGCMTEFENKDWFYSKDETPQGSELAYCMLYDYTVQALIDVIGEDVFVGAHCMGVTEGLWDECNFFKHCGQGINYATGKKGTRICFISTSFYDLRPGAYTSGYAIPELMEHLKSAAAKYGLNDVIFGVDEGRILCGNNSGKESDQLNMRITGYTWQAAYDARLYTQAINSGMDYFSSWGLLSNGQRLGYPTVSYHVANNISKLAGGRQAQVEKRKCNAGTDVESECLTSWNEDTQTLRVMTYNYKNKLNYKLDMNVKLDINVPQFDGKTVTVVKYLVSDDCNYFDEWQKDRKTYDIGDDCFWWSPDDPAIDGTTTLNDPEAREFYFNNLRDKYEQCAQLVPVTEQVKVVDGKLQLKDTLEPNNVIFYEIY